MLCTLSFVYCIFWISCSSILWTFLHNELFFSFVAVGVFTASPFRFVSFRFIFYFYYSESFSCSALRSSYYIFKITSFIKQKKDTHHTIRYPVERYYIEMNDSYRPYTTPFRTVFFFHFPFFLFFFFFSSLYSVFIFFPKESFVFFYVFIFSWNFMFVSVSVCSFSVELIIVMNLTFANTEVNKSPLDFAA